MRQIKNVELQRVTIGFQMYWYRIMKETYYKCALDPENVNIFAKEEKRLNIMLFQHCWIL